MQNVKQLVERHQANTRPADPASIQALQLKLPFPLSSEYKSFLSDFGVIVFGAYETYGLGVPADHYLNVLNAYTDLSRDASYPANALPLLEVGDGQYYLYDNEAQRIVLWATPNGGVVRVLDEGLDAFLSQKIFGE
ncbi:SMI1/KNR4 family protein [Paraburkholderia sediminicola]|uniref:SMI1/KNR4 family protein n=1 Tax=Paraburkholderia sediminicola TaxID=458836 RepID=UPI0038BB8E48